MAMPSLPSSINAAKWKTSAKEADKSGAVFAAIDKVAKAHVGYDAKALDGKPPKSADEAAKQRALLDAQAKPLAAVREAVKALDKASTDFKKDKDKSKADLAKQLDGMLADAEDYLKKLEAAAAEAATALAAATKSLGEKEGEEDEGDEGDANLDKLLGRVQGVLLRDLPKYEPKPGQPSVYRFFFAWAKGEGMLMAGKQKFGPKHGEMVKERWKAAYVPSNVTTGDLSFDAAEQTWVFSCRGKLPPRNALILALKKDKTQGGVGKSIKFKLQKLVKGKDGKESFEDATEQDEAAAGAGAETVPVAPPQVAAPTQAAAPAPQGAGGKDTKDGGADKPLPLPGFAPALNAWKQSRQRYEKEVAALANALTEIYREELSGADSATVRKAVNEARAKLAKTATLVGTTVEKALEKVAASDQRAAQRVAAARAKAEMDALATRLKQDPVFLSLEGKNNELRPDMTVVSDLTRSLKAVQDTMAEALKV